MKLQREGVSLGDLVPINIPRSLRRPDPRTETTGQELVALLLRGRARPMNGEDQALVEGMAVDMLHRIAVAEYTRIRDGAAGARRLRGSRDAGTEVQALAAALVVFAGGACKARCQAELEVALGEARERAVGRGYQIYCRGSEQHRPRRRGRS